MSFFANLGQHASFIVTAYGAAGVIVLSLVAWIVVDHRAQRRSLGELESRGVPRRFDHGKRA